MRRRDLFGLDAGVLAALDRTPPEGHQALYAVIGDSLGAGRPGSSD